MTANLGRGQRNPICHAADTWEYSHAHVGPHLFALPSIYIYSSVPWLSIYRVSLSLFQSIFSPPP